MRPFLPQSICRTPGRRLVPVIVLGMGIAAMPSARAQLLFAPASPYSVGGSPRGLVTTDVNGDGQLDLLVADGPSGGVKELLGDGKGGFGAVQPIATGDSEAVAAADFNRPPDGKVDLISVDAQVGTGGMAVLAGNGDGSFKFVSVAPVGSVPVAAAMADVTGDGQPDLLAANLLGNTVSAVLTGASGLTSATIPVGHGPAGIAVGDVNGDGVNDFLTANQGEGTVSVRLSKGDGTFTALPDAPAVPAATGLALGDFNGDGKKDVAVAGGVTVGLLLGKGDGTFGSPLALSPGGENLRAVAVGDFNGDGKLDMIVPGPGGVSVLPGNGDGKFGAPIKVVAGNSAYAFATGDFNGDGKLDLAIADNNGGTIYVLIQQQSNVSAPVFSAALPVPTGDSPTGIAVGDVNGDGKPDLVTANLGIVDGGSISLRLGKGDGTFESRGESNLTNHPEAVALGDFNGDGKQDLAIAAMAGGAGAVFLGSGDGKFNPSATFTLGLGPHHLAVGDFNGDGKLDLASAGRGASYIAVLAGNGDGTFQAPQTFPAGALPYGLVTADFNGDGKADLAGIDHADNVQDVPLVLGGSGGAVSGGSLAGGHSLTGIAVGDFNNDGKPDLATVDSHFGTVDVLLGSGGGKFLAAKTYGGAGDGSIIAGDFNGDGKLDLAVSSSSGGTVDPNTGAEDGSVEMFLGTGDGGFQFASAFDAGQSPGPLAVADFNGDGKLDLAAEDILGNQVLIFLNQTPSGSGTTAGDINGDGKITVADAILALQIVVGSFSPTATQRQAADTNGDGKVNIADATLILRKAVGL